ncbi:FecR domain-containing protein [Sphingomonas sp. LY54]|uniref:FecR family protein n=1 Tax=Sphingomonas sp. LY54 TaxID=3095343 RepID=UPI002D779A26|nr:FecR domain-containing protein [Sphingomonas sp. LY54]WRP28413.1 FecR domain-containing protein [Sphingomonas sp. LY54]
MIARETSRYIDEKAADWIARLDRGPLSDEESRALDAWLKGDPRRRGALLRADAVSLLSESAQALGPGFEPPPAPDRPVRLVSRRRALGWGAAVAVGASLVALGVSAPAGAITTRLGEVRLVTLDDGSTVILNTQSSVKVRYSATERRIELIDGEAYFAVVPGRRPFLVAAGNARLRASHAAFRVRKLGARPIDILVDRGGLALGGTGLPAPVVMGAHSRIVLPPPGPDAATPAPQPVVPDIVTRELAWREGKIALEGERLDWAAAEFARYSPVRIVIRDRGLAREPVTGLFAAGDPVGFSRAVAEIFGARVEQAERAVILSRQGGRQ